MSEIKSLKGHAAGEFIHEQIMAHSNGLEAALAQYNAQQSFSVWLETIRAIEEFINIPLFQLDDEDFEQRLVNLRLDNIDENQLKDVLEGLREIFSEGIVRRFITLVFQSSAIRSAFLVHGFLEAAAGLETVGHAIGYFQSRRGHLVTLLYTLPKACRGTKSISQMDSLNVFLPQIEHSGQTLHGLHTKRVLALVYPDIELTIEKEGFFANHSYETLDRFFSEPERVSIVEMTNGERVRDLLEPVDPSLVFSAAEVRNNIILLQDYYREFALDGTRFGAMAEFARDCLSLCKNDYFVSLSPAQFDNFANRAGLLKGERKRLVHREGNYSQNLNTKAAFVHVGTEFVSTVTLLSRFLNYWKNNCLNRIKRYQIRSGFIFEETVKEDLRKQGFHVTDIKRIEGKEFDVVAVLGDVIYNLQCKNNFVDFGKLQENPKLFVRYNRRLCRSYELALEKEKGREELLKKKLEISTVKHFVLSRFPVVTANEKVFAYLSIDEFRQRAVCRNT